MLHHISLREKIIVMIAVMSGMFLVSLDQTIISTALTRIVEDFHNYGALTWVVTAYLLTTTVTVPLSGKMSDIFGRRPMILLGVGLFVLSSLLCGIASNIEQLIAFRALQGIGGGIVMSNAFTIIGDLFSARERGKWQGLIASVFASSAVIGPLLGGFLTDGHSIAGLTSSWRWAFFINVPIGLVSFYILWRHCPPIRHDHKPIIDYKGAGLLAAMLMVVILAVDNTEHIFATVMEALDLSLMGLRIVMSLIVGVLLWFFVRVEQRAEEPIIPLEFFKNRTFTTVMSISLLNGAAFLGAIIYLTQFNQQVFSAGATEAGLMLLPMVFALGISSAVTGQYVSRSGKYKKPLIFGLGTATVSLAMFTILSADSTYVLEAVIMIFAGIGLGAAMPIINLAVQNAFTQRDLGVVTSSVQLFRSLGSAIGTAVLGGVLAVGVASGMQAVSNTAYADRVLSESRESGIDTDTAIQLNSEQSQQKVLQDIKVQAQEQPKNGSAQEQIALIKNEQQRFHHAVANAFAKGLHNVFLISAAIMACATVISLFLPEEKLKNSRDEAPGIE